MADRRLGRGLQSLISRTTEPAGPSVAEIPLEAIQPKRRALSADAISKTLVALAPSTSAPDLPCLRRRPYGVLRQVEGP